MTTNPTSSPRRSLFPALGWLLLTLSVLAMAVNLELAIRVFAPGWTPLETVAPLLVYMFTPLAADLSVVSTLVPVLLLGYPLLWLRRARIARRQGAIVDPPWDPYPEHFPFFLVMLGLYGTLYGMMIGLSISGVEGLAGGTPSAQGIRDALDRLLDGTATALLSSLVGMVGAFLAARPLPWLYRRELGLVLPEEPGLGDTVLRLTQELEGLCQTGREVRETWGASTISLLTERVASVERSSTRTAEEMAACVTEVRALRQSQDELLRLLQQSLAALGTALSPLPEQLVALRQGAERTATSTAALLSQAEAWQKQSDDWGRRLAQSLDDLSSRQSGMSEDLRNLRESEHRAQGEARADRDAVRRALSGYLGGGGG